MTTYIDLESLGPGDLGIKRADLLNLAGIGVPPKWREWLLLFGVGEGDTIRYGPSARNFYRAAPPSARLIDSGGREDSITNRFSWEEWALVNYFQETPTNARKICKSLPKTEKHSKWGVHKNACAIAYIFSHMQPFSPPPEELLQIGDAQISQSGPLEEYQWELVGEDTEHLTNLLIWAMEEEEVVGIDVETDTEGRRKPDELRDTLVGVGISFDVGNNYYGMAVGSTLESLLKEYLPYIQWVGHNAKYDGCVLRRHSIEYGPIVGDSMVAAYLTGKRGIGLKQLVQETYDVKMPTFEETIYPHSSIQDVDPKKVAKYCCGDAYYSLKLYQKYEEELAKEERLYRLYKEVQVPSINTLISMQLRGIAFDRESGIIELGEIKEKIDAIATAIDTLAKAEGYTGIPKKVTCQTCRNGSRKRLSCTTCGFRGQWEVEVAFNPSPSSPNTTWLLYDVLGLPVSSVSELTGKPTASVLALLRLQDKHNIVPLLLSWRTYKKQEEFLEAWLEASKEDGRVHTKFTNTWVRSQRLSSEDPNLQQVQQDLRRFFIC